MTDGQDNLSQINTHLNKKFRSRDNGTTCIFLGANQDAIKAVLVLDSHR